jgi:hypothetical protein
LNSSRHGVCRACPLGIYRTTSGPWAGLRSHRLFPTPCLHAIYWELASRSRLEAAHLAGCDSVWSRIRLGIESDLAEVVPIHPEHHRAPRHSFVAGIHLTDLQTERQLAAHIENLNLLGCFVETVTPFPRGTTVRLQISRAGVNFISHRTGR